MTRTEGARTGGLRWHQGLTKDQWLILLAAWLGWVFDVFDAAIFQLRKAEILTGMIGEPTYKLQGAAIEGWIQGTFLLGWAIGGLLFGIVADRYGRTRALIWTILVYATFTGLTALCQTPWQVGIARFITALGIGGEWAAGAALVAEALPDRARAAASSILQTAAAFGPALAAGANLLLADRSWHWLFVAGALPALLCLALRRLIREPEVPAKGPAKAPLAELWSRPESRRRALVAMVIGAVGIIGAGAATFWAPNLVRSASEGLDPKEITARISHVTWVSHIGTLAGVLLTPWLCERIGRRATIVWFYALCPIVVVGLVSTGVSYERLLWTTPMVNFFAIGVSAAFVLYFPELFPREIRATGAGLAYNVGRIFAIPMPILMGSLISQHGGNPAVAFGVLACIYLVGLAAIPFAPETKDKPLGHG